MIPIVQRWKKRQKELLRALVCKYDRFWAKFEAPVVADLLDSTGVEFPGLVRGGLGSGLITHSRGSGLTTSGCLETWFEACRCIAEFLSKPGPGIFGAGGNLPEWLTDECSSLSLSNLMFGLTYACWGGGEKEFEIIMRQMSIKHFSSVALNKM